MRQWGISEAPNPANLPSVMSARLLLWGAAEASPATRRVAVAWEKSMVKTSLPKA